jgi:hypothetical protein
MKREYIIPALRAFQTRLEDVIMGNSNFPGSSNEKADDGGEFDWGDQ